MRAPLGTSLSHLFDRLRELITLNFFTMKQTVTCHSKSFLQSDLPITVQRTQRSDNNNIASSGRLHEEKWRPCLKYLTLFLEMCQKVS